MDTRCECCACTGFTHFKADLAKLRVRKAYRFDCSSSRIRASMRERDEPLTHVAEVKVDTRWDPFATVLNIAYDVDDDIILSYDL